MEEKLNKILEAIYWKKFTPNQKTVISNIIKSDCDSMSKATEICNFLGIERRVNRRVIIHII